MSSTPSITLPTSSPTLSGPLSMLSSRRRVLASDDVSVCEHGQTAQVLLNAFKPYRHSHHATSATATSALYPTASSTSINSSAPSSSPYSSSSSPSPSPSPLVGRGNYSSGDILTALAQQVRKKRSQLKSPESSINFQQLKQFEQQYRQSPLPDRLPNNSANSPTVSHQLAPPQLPPWGSPNAAQPNDVPLKPINNNNNITQLSSSQQQSHPQCDPPHPDSPSSHHIDVDAPAAAPQHKPQFTHAFSLPVQPSFTLPNVVRQNSGDASPFVPLAGISSLSPDAPSSSSSPPAHNPPASHHVEDTWHHPISANVLQHTPYVVRPPHIHAFDHEALTHTHPAATTTTTTTSSSSSSSHLSPSSDLISSTYTLHPSTIMPNIESRTHSFFDHHLVDAHSVLNRTSSMPILQAQTTHQSDQSNNNNNSSSNNNNSNNNNNNNNSSSVPFLHQLHSDTDVLPLLPRSQSDDAHESEDHAHDKEQEEQHAMIPAHKKHSYSKQDERLIHIFLQELGATLFAVGLPMHICEFYVVLVGHRLHIDVHIISINTHFWITYGDHTVAHMIQGYKPGLSLSQMVDVCRVCEDILTGTMSPLEGLRRTKEISHRPPLYPKWLMVPMMSAICAVYTPFFGGAWVEMAVAACAGMVVGFWEYYGDRLSNLSRGHDLICGAFAAMFAILCHSYVTHIHLLSAIFGGIIWNLPGLRVLLAMLDMTTGNPVTGTAKFFSAIIVVINLGIGVVAGLSIGQFTGQGDVDILQSKQYADEFKEWMINVLVIFSVIPGVYLLDVHWRHSFQMCVGSFVAYLASNYGTIYLGPSFGSWVAAAAVGVVITRNTHNMCKSNMHITCSYQPLYQTIHSCPLIIHVIVDLIVDRFSQVSNLYGRFTPYPSTELSMFAIIMLVPGSIGLRGVLANDSTSTVSFLMNMITVAIALVTGLFTANILVPPFRSI